MRQPDREREIPEMMNSVNSAMNHHQLLSSLQDIHNHGHPPMLPPSNFDPASSHEDFLEQMLSAVPSSAADAFPWADDQPPPELKMRMGNGAVKALMLQQQLMMATGGPMTRADRNDVDEAAPNPANLSNDASIKAFLNGFTGSVGQTSNQSQHFHQGGGALQQSQNFAAAASGSSGGGAATGQPKQRVRARRGQATDPHSIAERLRRERIAERMKSLQELVPNANKTDKASMLDEIIDYVKFLQLQVKIRGAAAVAPLVAADKSPERKSGASSSNNNNNEGMTVAERQVAKLMEEDMGSAMQYLQGKGLCLMPISLATAISTATSHSRNPLTPLLNGDTGGPTSPSISGLTVQSGRDVSLTDVPKLE